MEFSEATVLEKAPRFYLENEQLNWYALYTRPNFEKRVVRDLDEMGIEGYLPLKRSLRQWSDRKKWIESPLFSCYVFVHVSRERRVQSLKADGVVCMLSSRGKPSSIPDSEIQIVKDLIANDLDPAPAHDFAPGDMLEIISGPLKGLRGMSVMKKGKRRMLVTLEGMRQMVSIKLGPNHVRRLSAGERDSFLKSSKTAMSLI